MSLLTVVSCSKPEVRDKPVIVILEDVDVAATRIMGVRDLGKELRIHVFPVRGEATSTREVLFSRDINHGVVGFEGASFKRFPLDNNNHVWAFLRAPKKT